METTTHNLGVEHEIICEKCGTPKTHRIEIGGKVIYLKCMCKCEAEAYKKDQERQEQEEQILRLSRLRATSMMDKEFSRWTFKNAQIDNGNKKYFQVAKRYVDKWDEIKAKNIGLLLYGNVGRGKTYLAGCIANALLEKYVSVIMISGIRLLGIIRETFKKKSDETDYSIIHSLENVSLLIIDDLGAERGLDWEIEKIYEIIDSRYRSKRPLIVTTNLTPKALKEKLCSDDGITRTYDRIAEMCTLYEIDGEARRIKQGLSKRQIANDLLGLEG